MKKSILFLMLTGLLIACNGEDDGYNSRLNGMWNMINFVSSSNDTQLPALNEGDITWSINADVVKITNNVHHRYPQTLPTGTYSAKVNVNERTITIENGDLDPSYNYNVTDRQLSLTERNTNSSNDVFLIFN